MDSVQASEIHLSSLNADCVIVSVSVICIRDMGKGLRFQAAACHSGNEAAQKAAKHRQPLPTHMHLQHITQEGTI